MLPLAQLTRRSFLGTGVTAGLLLATGLRPAGGRAGALDPAPPPFALGVASGDPRPQPHGPRD
jgi:phosphodiesterase/alkaline phosphatase D-like protein